MAYIARVGQNFHETTVRGFYRYLILLRARAKANRRLIGCGASTNGYCAAGHRGCVGAVMLSLITGPRQIVKQDQEAPGRGTA